MNKENVIKIINENLNVFDLVNTFVYPNIPPKKNKNARNSHQLGLYEEILILQDYTLFGSATESLVITENGLSFVIDDDYKALKISWSQIESVEFIDDYCYFFYDKEKKTLDKFSKTYVFVCIDDYDKYAKDIARVLVSISQTFENKEMLLFNSTKELFENNELEKFLENSEKYLTEFGDNGLYSFSIRFMRANAFYKLQDFDKALFDINNNLDILYKNEDLKGQSKLFELKSLVQSAKSDNYSSLQTLQTALEIAETNNDKDRLKNLITKTYKTYTNNFKTLDFAQRKLILVDSSISDLTPTSFSVLQKNELPKIQFPIGHPIEKELYVGHPYNAEIYIPLQSYEFELFIDRINEFCYLLQCLGATEFKISTIKGLETDILEKQKSNIEIGGKVKIHNADGERTKNTELNSQDSLKRQVGKIQKFSPTKKPYLPNDLVWYKNEPSWQRLFQQRISGSILEYHERISTTQKRLFSEHEYNKVKSEFKNVLVRAKIEVTSDIETKFKEQEITEWEISVTFAPINDLYGEEQKIIEIKDTTANISTTSLSNQEQDYIEMYEDAFEDFVITDDELRMLERRRQKLGLSEQRAKELAEMVKAKKSFTKEEMEYMDEVKFCLENDKEITQDERRMLDRLKSKLNLTNEKVAELEEFVMKH